MVVRLYFCLSGRNRSHEQPILVVASGSLCLFIQTLLRLAALLSGDHHKTRSLILLFPTKARAAFNRLLNVHETKWNTAWFGCKSCFSTYVSTITESNWKARDWEPEKAEIPHSFRGTNQPFYDRYLTISCRWNTDWRKQTCGLHWACIFFFCLSGRRLQKPSFLVCAALWRESCPSSAARLWAQILPTSVALWLGEEAACLFEWTTSHGEDPTAWGTLTTERGGPLNSSIRPAGVQVSDDYCWVFFVLFNILTAFRQLCGLQLRTVQIWMDRTQLRPEEGPSGA